MIDNIVWCTGAATWLGLTCIGALWLFDQVADWVIREMWSREELLAFVADRLKRK